MSNNSYPTLPADDRFGNPVPTAAANPDSGAVLVEYRNRLLEVRDRLSGVMAQRAANDATIVGAMKPPPRPAHIARTAGAHEPSYHSHILPRSSLIPSQSTSNPADSARTEDSTTPSQSPWSFPPKFPQNLPSGWLPDTCTTRLNQNLNQMWNAVYRPGVNGEYCKHTIHSAWDGTRHLLIPTEPVVRSGMDPGFLQSATCWLTMFPKDENAYVNPTNFSETDYNIFSMIPPVDQAEQLVNELGTAVSLYLDKAATRYMPGTCSFKHTDEERKRHDQEELYAWATVAESGETIYMCRSCMRTRTGRASDADVFAKYQA